MRICSFLPAATETLFALGLGESVVGVSHECDYPSEVRTKVIVVRSRIEAGLSAAEINNRVVEFTSRKESPFAVDLDALRALAPDLIVTQDLCHVCAPAAGDFPAALASSPHPPRVLTLSPRRLADVWEDVRRVGEAAGRPSQGHALATTLDRRVEVVHGVVGSAETRPRAVCLEWLDPPYVAGHWVPEMVDCAGGQDVLGRAGEPSFRVDWRAVIAARPEFLLVMPCGYAADQVVDEFRALPLPQDWDQLPAVRAGRSYALDARSYFSRPAPRLAQGVEILARLFHPDRASWPRQAGAVRELVRANTARN